MIRKVTIIGMLLFLWGCSSGATTPKSLLKNPDTEYYSVHFLSGDFNPGSLTVKSKINGTEGPIYQFDSEFYLEANSDLNSCAGNTCWSLWFLEGDQWKSVSKEVVEQVNNSILDNIIELKQPFIDLPVRINLYLAPPDAYFEDSYQNREEHFYDLGIAVHNQYEIPEKKLSYRLYVQEHANSISKAMHELYHVLSLASGKYNEPYSASSLFHNEVIGKCWQYQSYLNVIAGTKAFLMLSKTQDDIMREAYGGLTASTASIYSDDFLFRKVRNVLKLTDSPSNLGDQIVIYGNQKSESKLIKDLCMSLIDIEPKKMFDEYQYLTY
ncbi:hypothetical protein ACR0ST_05765 [Aliidiomarina sp. Khilg15.8]